MTGATEMQKKTVQQTSAIDINTMVSDRSLMANMVRLAEYMSASHYMVPRYFHNKVGDCFGVIMQAIQWGMNPFAVIQKMYPVNGLMAYESQLVNAVISGSNAISGRFKYEYKEWSGMNGLVRCGAVLAGESHITWGEWLDTATVTVKDSCLWLRAPRQQAAYLAIKYWARLYCPDVILGVYTSDELSASAPETHLNTELAKAEKDTVTDDNSALNLLKNALSASAPETHLNTELAKAEKDTVTDDNSALNLLKNALSASHLNTEPDKVKKDAVKNDSKGDSKGDNHSVYFLKEALNSAVI